MLNNHNNHYTSLRPTMHNYYKYQLEQQRKELRLMKLRAMISAGILVSFIGLAISLVIKVAQGR